MIGHEILNEESPFVGHYGDFDCLHGTDSVI